MYIYQLVEESRTSSEDILKPRCITSISNRNLAKGNRISKGKVNLIKTNKSNSFKRQQQNVIRDMNFFF